MAISAPGATLDILPLKRVLALEESGNELLPVEPTSEEKPLALLGRIDFGQTDGQESKKAKTGKEAQAAPAAPVWPWQALVENLQQAQQELNIIMDLISHVEANDAISVVHMIKPKLLPNEAFNDLSLRGSSKISKFRDVGKYFKRTAQALEAQVEREAVFYGALMRIQRNWKVKRQRGVAAGPGGSAGFSIDLSFPLPADGTSLSSARSGALSSVSLDQDLTGLLQAKNAVGGASHKLNLTLRTTRPGHTLWERLDTGQDASAELDEMSNEAEGGGALEAEQTLAERGVGKGVDEGAKGAQAVLRHIQGVMYDEQVFEWVGREAVLPNSGMNVIGIGDMCLQFSLGHAASLTLELSKSELGGKHSENGDHEGNAGKTEDDSGGKWSTLQRLGSTQTPDRMKYDIPSPRFHGQRVVPNESSLVVCLHQAFHQGVFGFPVELDPGLVTFKMGVGKKEGGGSKPKESLTAAAQGAAGKEAVNGEVASAMKHFSATMCHRVLSSRVLSELEKQVSQVPHVQLLTHPTWHPRVSAWDLSLATPICSSRKGSEWTSAATEEVRFQCMVVLRDESLVVEGLEGESKLDIVPLSKQNVGLSELQTFLLFQVAAGLVSWLYDEALTMGLKVSRDLLSVVFRVEGCDDVAIVACPDVKALCITWWMRTWSPGMEDVSQKEDFGSDTGQHQRCLGPVGIDTLRRLVLDLINLESNLEAGLYD